MLYFSSGETGTSIQLGNLVKSSKTVYQQWVQDLCSETPSAKDMMPTLHAFQVVWHSARSKLGPGLECQFMYLICSQNWSRSSALLEHALQFSFIQSESSLWAPKQLLCCDSKIIKQEKERLISNINHQCRHA